jgi:hypothetical protein
LVSSQREISLKAISLTMFVFGLLTWFYVIVIQITHEEWLVCPLTHYDIPVFNLRVDDVGIMSFAIALLGFLVWRIETERKHSEI